MRDLSPFFRPKSIAIVGASSNFQTISGKPLIFLRKHGYQGTIYPINPKYEEIDGWKCYSDLVSLPESPDVAMLIVKASRVLEQLEACYRKGITHVIVVSSGFAELNQEGFGQQQSLVEFAKSHGMSLIGPNSQGLVNLVDPMTLSFSGALEEASLFPGDIGFISQSGAFGNSVFSLGQDHGIGFAYVVCTGNEADVNTFDLIEWMVEDDKVRVIACYNEGFKDTHRLRELSERSKKMKKPILWFKSGKSEVGQKAAGSHTGALAGEDAVFDKLIQQYGMMRVHDIHEIFDTVNVFRGGRYPKGNKVGILTTSGGTGVMLADELIELGFEVPRLSKKIQDELAQVLPPFASLQNPIDVTAQVVAQPELFQLTGEILARHEVVDIICISVTMVVGEAAKKVSNAIVELHRRTQVPIIVSWTIDKRRIQSAVKKFTENDIPLLQTPVRAAHALNHLMLYSQFLQEETNHCEPSPKQSIKQLIPSEHFTEYTMKKALSDVGFQVPKETLVNSVSEAISTAEEIGYPVVLKVVSEKIKHKTEANGVKLGIRNNNELREAYGEIEERMKQKNNTSLIDGYLVQKMVDHGVELLIGATNRPPYGTVVTVGFGGIWVELIKDITYRQAPFSYDEAMKMLKELKGYPLLEGFRGGVKINLEELGRFISKFSEWVATIIDFEEIEMNPVIVDEEGPKIVDAICIPKK
jgi:acetate---CoA ligase (ADP-forming)